MNAERLLGALLKKGLRSGRRGRRRRRRSGLGGLIPGGLTGAAGIGLLGVAIAAYEHYSQKSQPPAPSGPVPGGGPGQPPPAPGSRAATPPPPPPGPPPAPPEAPGSARQPGQDQAILLIRAMIAAANADGQIDADERHAILGKLQEAGLGEEERRFLAAELAHPPSLESLLARIDSPELAEQVYAASLLAVEVDTKAEKSYLSYLQARLGLSDPKVEEIERSLS